MSDPIRQDSGSVTAEFVVLLPAVLLVLAFCLGGIFAMTRQLQAQDIAMVLVRAEARGEEIAPSQTVPGLQRQIERTGNLICVSVSLPIRIVGIELPQIAASAKSCAFDE